MEQLAHDGDDGLERGFVAREQLLVEGPNVRLMGDGRQGGHVESAAPVSIAIFEIRGGVRTDVPDSTTRTSSPACATH
jgi:hypothetical protein